MSQINTRNFLRLVRAKTTNIRVISEKILCRLCVEFVFKKNHKKKGKIWTGFHFKDLVVQMNRTNFVSGAERELTKNFLTL